MDEVLARLRSAIVVPVRYRINGLTGAAAQLPMAEAVFAGRPCRIRLVNPWLTLTPERMDGFERHIHFFDSLYLKKQDGKQPCRAGRSRVRGLAVRWPVSRVLSRFPGDGYSSSAAVAGNVEQPTRT